MKSLRIAGPTSGICGDLPLKHPIRPDAASHPESRIPIARALPSLPRVVPCTGFAQYIKRARRIPRRAASLPLRYLCPDLRSSRRTSLIIDIMFATHDVILTLTKETFPATTAECRRAPHRTPRQTFDDDVGTLSSTYRIIVSRSDHEPLTRPCWRSQYAWGHSIYRIELCSAAKEHSTNKCHVSLLNLTANVAHYRGVRA